MLRDQQATGEPGVSPSNERKNRRPIDEVDFSTPDDGKIIKTTLTPTSSQDNVELKDIDLEDSKPPVDPNKVTLCCIPLHYVVIFIGLFTLVTCYLYIVLIDRFDVHIAFQVTPIIVYIYLTALFVNAKCKPKRSLARKALYISYLFMTIAEEAFFVYQSVSYVFSYALYYFVA